MTLWYAAAMGILQVRDLPDDVIATLRRRAEAEGISLSAYVRSLLAHEAAQTTPAEVAARFEALEPLDVTDEEIIAAIHEGRR